MIKNQMYMHSYKKTVNVWPCASKLFNFKNLKGSNGSKGRLIFFLSILAEDRVVQRLEQSIENPGGPGAP